MLPYPNDIPSNFTVVSVYFLIPLNISFDFFVQYCLFEFGILQCFLHPCQKHESMKITTFLPFIEISGFPYNPLSFFLYLYPKPNNRFLISFSILESWDFTAFMVALLLGETFWDFSFFILQNIMKTVKN